MHVGSPQCRTRLVFCWNNYIINFYFSSSAAPILFIQKRSGILEIDPSKFLFPNFVSKVFLPVFFPKASLPKGDRICFAQEEPLVPQLRPSVLVCDKVVA